MVNYGGEMRFIAQTDPAWEYWDTSTYLGVAIAFAVIATVAASIALSYWRKVEKRDKRGTS